MALDATALTTDNAEEGLTTEQVETLHSHQQDLLRAEADDHLAKLTRKRDELVERYPAELAHLEALIEEAEQARKDLG